MLVVAIKEGCTIRILTGEKKSSKTLIDVQGKVYKDNLTKDLVRRLKPGSIAFINHQNIDDMAVESLIRSRIKAVVNVKSFFTGSFPLYAPVKLLNAGIVLLEEVGEDVFKKLEDGDYIWIKGNALGKQEKLVGRGKIFTKEDYRKRFDYAKNKEEQVWSDFLENTLRYAYREKNYYFNLTGMPLLKTNLKNQDVVVVARGKNYREDLKIIRPYLKEAHPVLIGVDGGGDALWEAGFRPHIIVGDMDSVSDRVLQVSDEIVVHSYADHRISPGIDRLKKLSLPFHRFSIPGTSEDVAMLLAYEKGAQLIVALGTHFGVLDFLEKGRPGMASTFLVRLKVSDRLIDAKGVSRLYQKGKSFRLVPLIILSALIPFLVLLTYSPLVQHLFQLFLLRLRLAW